MTTHGPRDNAQRTSHLTSDSGPSSPLEGSSGPLVDYNTGITVPATLTTEGGTWNGKNQTGQGVLSNAGTDGYGVFIGKVDAKGVVSYGKDLKLTLSGLDPSLRY